jgi:hypothetical protein
MLCVAVPEVRTSRDEAGLAVADVVLDSLEELSEQVWARLEIRPGSRVRVVRRHVPPDRPPIVVAPGDELSVGERDDQWPAFVLVTTAAGLQGWVPQRDLTRMGGRNEQKYTPRIRYDTAELTVDPRDELTVVETDLGSGWLRCRDPIGSEGWVPVRCLEPIASGPRR